jgi:hypothetical protein
MLRLVEGIVKPFGGRPMLPAFFFCLTLLVPPYPLFSLSSNATCCRSVCME